MSILVNFQSAWSRDGLCRRAQLCKSHPNPSMRNDLGTSES
jgi:hypothetical protein